MGPQQRSDMICGSDLIPGMDRPGGASLSGYEGDSFCRGCSFRNRAVWHCSDEAVTDATTRSCLLSLLIPSHTIRRSVYLVVFSKSVPTIRVYCQN